MEEVKTAWQIATLKKHVMHHIAGDGKKTVFGYYIIIAAAILGMLGQMIIGIRVPFMGVIRPALLPALGGAVIQIISTVIGIYVISFIAQSVFKGHAKHEQFFRVAGYSMIVMWISAIPQLAFIGAIWGLVLLFVILKTVHKLTTGGTIGTLILSFLAMMGISLILSPLYGILGFGGGMEGSFKMSGENGFMDFDKNSMNIKTEEGDAQIDFDGGSMKIKTDDGETVEINIPKFE
ncbi:Yip1 family protein [candidate division KSB1 bacterium]